MTCPNSARPWWQPISTTSRSSASKAAWQASAFAASSRWRSTASISARRVRADLRPGLLRRIPALPRRRHRLPVGRQGRIQAVRRHAEWQELLRAGRPSQRRQRRLHHSPVRRQARHRSPPCSHRSRISAARPLARVEIAMDNSEYVSSLDRARLLAVGMALLGLAIAAAAGLLIARSISHPILAITGAMRDLADGNLDVDACTTGAPMKSARWRRLSPCSRQRHPGASPARRTRTRPRPDPNRRSGRRSGRWPTALKPASAA